MNSLRHLQRLALTTTPRRNISFTRTTADLASRSATRLSAANYQLGWKPLRGVSTETDIQAQSVETTVSNIQHFYASAHKPLVHQEKKYGPPYTDTSKLEQLPEDLYLNHIPPRGVGEKLAKGLVEFFKIFTRLFFRDKYTHHAVTLETVAAVPGMIAGMLRHLTSLRRMQRDYGWIPALLEEAENERMHLLTWMQLISPTFTERMVVFAAQCFYTPFYALLYVTSPRIAHKFVGYLEETACHEYTQFLKAIDEGKIPNVPAPEIAKVYWNLAPDARLRDVVLVVRADEVMHRDVNHEFSHKISAGMH